LTVIMPARSRAISTPDSIAAWLGIPLFGVALLWLWFSYGYVEDDAFIHLEFARSFAEGAGFAFNGRLVNGDTAPLWVVLLAAMHSLGAGWIAASKILGCIGVAVAASGIWRVASSLSGGSPERNYLAPACLLATALNPYFIHWSFSGMESVSALGVSLWAIWAIFSSPAPEWRRLAAGALLLSIAPLLRPELLLLSAVAGAVLLYRAWRLPALPASRVLTLALFAMVMALPTALWSAYALDAFGSIIPNTNAAKRGGDLLPVAAKLVTVYAVGFSGTLALLAILVPRLLKHHVPAMIWMLLLWPLACAAFYLLDHTAVQTRYCLLSMPCLTIAVLWLLQKTVNDARFRGAVGAITCINLYLAFAIVYPHVSNKIALVKTASAAAAYIREQLPSQAPVAVYAIGQLAFESRHPLIDIGGITRPEVLPYTGDLAAIIRWARGEGAQFYIGGERPAESAEPLYSYSVPFLGWSLNRANYGTTTQTAIYRLR
jgi:hypothetical protein